MVSPPVDPVFGLEPVQCPITVLFGAEVSRLLYSDPTFRPALDAWDTGEVSKDDIRRWCLVLEREGGLETFFIPSATWRMELSKFHSANLRNALGLLQSREEETKEPPAKVVVGKSKKKQQTQYVALASLERAFQAIRRK